MLQIQLGNHPVGLHLVPDGRIGFTPIGDFNNVMDYSDNLEVHITRMGITIIDNDSRDEENITYGIAIDYKNKPLLLEWLKSFKLHFNSAF